ncbi:MAG: mucoidy inhibitor MuiA family protein [Bacteroidetes bacterium]|nr:mucoidy inhibitor MuiA family protein [Bacteroidota bacterium]
MKNLTLIVLILWSASAFSDNQRISLNSDVNGVKVFLSGAQVIRTAKGSVDAGSNEVAIEGLSSQVTPSSIIVSGTGDAMIMGVSYTLDYLKDKKKSPELTRLEDSLESLKSILVRHNMNESVYNDELQLLNANKNTSGSNVGVNAENLKKVADFYRQRSIELKTKLIEISEVKVKLNEKIGKVTAQINELNEKLDRPTGTILVTIEAKQRTNITLNVSYYVPAASWTPLYELHGKDVKSPVELIYKASVRQSSGENWSKVPFTLSTGNPQLNNTKPNLVPWFVDFVQIYQMEGLRGARAEPAPMMKSNVQNDFSLSTADAQMEEIQVVQSETAVSVEFEIKQNYSVNTDGKDVIMTIEKHDLPSQFAYYAAPRIDRTAYLMASISGWEQLNLLPGKANIYFENSYVGESFINPTSTADTLRLSMGRDARIVIKRTKVKDLSSVKFLGSNTIKNYTFDISVKNNRGEVIDLILEDQVPVTRNESIKISIDETSGAEFNTETGMLKWRLKLNSAENKKLRLVYSVKYPKDQNVSGLE